MNATLKFTTLILLLASFVTNVNSSELPPAFQARYKVEMSGLTLGEIKIDLEYKNGRYYYRKKTKTKGLMSFFRSDTITEQSEGKVNGSELDVSSYQYIHKRKKKPKKSNIEFTSSGYAAGKHKDHEFKISSPDNSFDRASVELALMRDAGEDILTYHVVQKGQLGHYTFRSKGKLNLNLPAGDFSCEEYEVERSSTKRKTSICLSEELNHLPIQATHDEKGKIITMSLLNVEFSGITP